MPLLPLSVLDQIIGRGRSVALLCAGQFLCVGGAERGCGSPRGWLQTEVPPNGKYTAGMELGVPTMIPSEPPGSFQLEERS